MTNLYEDWFNKHKKLNEYKKPLSYLLYISIYLNAIYNIKEYTLIKMVLMYMFEEMIFISGHIYLHSTFKQLTLNKQTRIAHYHHYYDPSIYEKMSYLHRTSYFNRLLLPVYLILALVFSHEDFSMFALILSYEIIVHESYHVRNPEYFYKENIIRYVEKKFIDIGAKLKIHDREKHREHHIQTINNNDDVWDNLWLFGKYESLVKNKYANFIWKSSGQKKNLIIINFVCVIFLIVFSYIKMYGFNENYFLINFKYNFLVFLTCLVPTSIN